MELKETFRKDYKAPSFSIAHINMDFRINEEVTIVNTILKIIPKSTNQSNDLFLDGQKDVKLKVLHFTFYTF